ncbi:MAG: Cof-type HAD-IIB family hydrolase [Paraprevotella sp.]|nr:Cof-type HAD-IIB family hydrolase [Paraprevotella sp.]
MRYKILVLDLDGTLTNKKKEITPHTRETLIRAQERGLKVVLASGRPTYGIVPLAEELRLGDFEGYILSYNGGQIIDWTTKKRIYENVLDPEIYPYLYDCARSNGFLILSYKDEYIISEDSGNPYVLHEAFLNRMGSITVPNFLDVINFPVPKCLIVGDPSPLSRLESEMKHELEGRMNVFRSEPFFLELVPKGLDKARSLDVLLHELGMTPEEMIAVEDGFNDLSMIKFAGLGVAMANAQEVVRHEANYITLSNEEDGVAAVVDKFCLSDKD